MKRNTCLVVVSLAALVGAACFAAEPPLTVTIYNNNLAMIQELRALQLARGMQEYRISDVTAQIEPASVRLQPLTAPDAFRLQEQRFEFDLAGTDRLLERYLGQPIVVTIEEGGTYRGSLLNAQEGDAILELEDGSIQVVKAHTITTLQFPALPQGLVTKPTLVWRIECAKPGQHQAALSYLTRGMQWQAEYTAATNEEGDRLELCGWASIENRSGLAFTGARLQLVAGDVHRVSPEPYLARGRVKAEAAVMAEAPSQAFEEQPLFEYHLYTLDRPATLTDRQVNQLSLFPAASVKTTREFTYDGARDGEKVRINLVLNNTKENGLGKPLPGGRMRVYKTSAGGRTETFVGEDQIDHVAEGEEVRVYLGNAFDLVGERTVTEARQISKRSRQETVEISLRNRKDNDVTVTVIEHLRGDWKFIGETPKIKKKEAYKVEFEVTVPKTGEKTFSYQVLHKW